MHRSDKPLDVTILALARFINDPRQDWRLMTEAGLDLDPMFLPLLVRLGAGGPPHSVVELAGQLGKDHSTVSRQLAKLEAADLVARQASASDGRVRAAHLTPKGEAAVATLSAARRRLFDRALAGWTPADRETLTRLFSRFTDGLRSGM
jgi:DNA-binding MarR family transcriptional regulator